MKRLANLSVEVASDGGGSSGVRVLADGRDGSDVDEVVVGALVELHHGKQDCQDEKIRMSRAERDTPLPRRGHA